WRPGSAAALGLHEYDGGVTDLSRASIDAERARLHAVRATLAAVDRSALSPRRATSLRNAMASVDADLFHMETQDSYARNPMSYTDLVDVNQYVKRNYAPLETRIRAVTASLRRVPDVLAAGRANLDEKLPRPFIETAVTDAKGFVEFIDGELVTALAPVKDEALQADFVAARTTASAAMTDFVKWLETERLPNS